MEPVAWIAYQNGHSVNVTRSKDEAWEWQRVKGCTVVPLYEHQLTPTIAQIRAGKKYVEQNGWNIVGLYEAMQRASKVSSRS